MASCYMLWMVRPGVVSLCVPGKDIPLIKQQPSLIFTMLDLGTKDTTLSEDPTVSLICYNE